MFKKLQSNSNRFISLDAHKFDFPGPDRTESSSPTYTAMGRTQDNFNSRTVKKKLK